MNRTEGVCYLFPREIVERAKTVARILSEHGIHVNSPDDGDLDDVERERWNACVEIVKALFG